MQITTLLVKNVAFEVTSTEQVVPGFLRRAWRAGSEVVGRIEHRACIPPVDDAPLADRIPGGLLIEFCFIFRYGLFKKLFLLVALLMIVYFH